MGKFSNNLDRYAYEATLDTGAHEELGSSEEGDWFGLLWIDGPMRKAIRDLAADYVALNESEEEVLDGNEAVILHERGDGIVETTWLATEEEADEEWEAVREEFDEEEED